MPMARSFSIASTLAKVDTATNREPAAVGSKRISIRVSGSSEEGLPSGLAKPSSTSMRRGASTATKRQ